ncbi:MAG: MarR family winged helix-turn-helix transcriptional regulator [Hyphomonadaceae bacterium]
MREPVSELSDHLGYWLRYVSNHVSQSFAAKVEGKGVSVAEWVLLRALYGADAMSPSRLAGELGMTKGAITKIVDRLVARKMVSRRPDPSDGRGQSISLTASGARLTPELAALADRNDQEHFAKLSASDRKTLRRLLQQLVKDAGMKTVPTE